MRSKSQLHFDDDAYRLFWDIVKGIGIVSIVIGHSCGAFVDVTRFVYLYHLPIFFFVSGFLYSEKKYGDAPHLNIAARMRSTWPKYVAYMVIYILLHNSFREYGVIINAKEYGLSDIVIGIVTSVTFTASETMGGALWFVPVLVVASGLFGCIVFLSRAVERWSGYSWCKYFTALLLTVMVGGVGVYTNMYGMYFTWHIQTSFVVVPLFTMAWLISTRIKNWREFLHWIPGIAAGAVMIYGIKKWKWAIELSANQIVGSIEFYVIAVLGIYFCLVVAKYLLNIPGARKAIALLGKHSFDIMAGHFLAFKLVDIVYARMIQETDVQVYGAFPVAYISILWPIYLAAGLILPTAAICIWEMLKNRLFGHKAV